jgi:hypothetical protein
MLATRVQTAVVAVGERAASRGLSDGDRPPDDSRAVARRTCADPARYRTGRKRIVDPTACEAGYAAAVEEFQQAMENYKRRSGRMFPTWSEVLEVLQGLGYEKAAGEPVSQGARSEGAGDRGSRALP